MEKRGREWEGEGLEEMGRLDLEYRAAEPEAAGLVEPEPMERHHPLRRSEAL
jgi:hypothetical protein